VRRKPRCGPGTPAPVDPFKPDDDLLTKLRAVVLAELSKVVSKNMRLSSRNPRVMRLAYVSILIDWKVRAGPRRDSLEETIRRGGSVSNIPNTHDETLAWGRWVQDGRLPQAQQGYAQWREQTRWGTLDLAKAQGGLPEKQRRLEELKVERERYPGEIATLEREVKQLEKKVAEFVKDTKDARDARRRALELAQPILEMHEVRDEKDFAPKLQAIFLSELPDRHKKIAGYSFVAAVASVILRKRVTVIAVASFLSHPQRVKSRAHRGQVKSGKV